MKPAISVRHLSKSYQIAHGRDKRYRTLRDELAGLGHRLLRGQWKEKTSETFWALQDISFEVMPGEIVGVIGRNGAGKSTLLKILSRITPPHSGDIFLRGRIGSLLEVGTGFHPELTGRENIFLSGAVLGMKRSEVAAKFDQIVAFAEVERFLDSPVKRYSTGMYVRLAFSVAAHLDTEILLVDEVLAVGDAAFQKKCLNRMKEVGESGRTVLFVSHSMAAMANLCEKGLVLQSGKALPLMKISEAIDNYVSVHETARTEWQGTAGDESVELVRTWISQKTEAHILKTSESLEVGLSVVLKKRIDGLLLGFNLLSEFGNPLAYTLFDDAGTSPETALEAGPLTCTFQIPANLLSQGSYAIRFDVAIHNFKRIIHEEGSLTFSLENTGGIGTRYAPPRGPATNSLFRSDWKVKSWRGL